VNDDLQRRINEHVLNGDAPSIIWAMEGQIRINTKLEAKLAELERREALLTAVVVAHDAENGAWWNDDGKGDPFDWHERWEHSAEAVFVARKALTDAGFPWTDGDR
jgi:hypothetical protein